MILDLGGARVADRAPGEAVRRHGARLVRGELYLAKVEMPARIFWAAARS
jgi:hypothetical protein